MEDCTVTTETIDGIHHTYYTRDGIIVAECRRSIEYLGNVERWYRHGKYHRDDEPAVIKYKNGQVIEEHWYRDGKQHRDDGPAAIYYKNGQVIEEHWYSDDKLHRDDGPARIRYENGERIRERWCRNSKHHRVDGPAIVWYKNGQIVEECWYRDDKLYTNGRLVAVIHYNFESIDKYVVDAYRRTTDVQLFRDKVKGNAIHDALRPLPIPIRDAIIPHYCYQ
jgi:antitoxin component YwqK of YwqJK toxin-antitoxin module